MATDVDVQYFSHLNGLTLANNWGDLIRLLDKALVTGIDFTQITSALIDAQGDVHITLYAAHNAMLFQVVELSGFTPASLNQKYRIKGVPNTTQLILKPHTAIVETSITTVGAGKLAPLGYEIIFRDAADVKRVYRAKNPTAQHPFIRVDESLTSPDGTTGVYTSTYAKYAMVGLLEHMEHIDDYETTGVLQLPFNPTDLAKNWKINGAAGSVVRGWSKWYYACANEPWDDIYETASPPSGNRNFTLVGDKGCFYLLRNLATNTSFGKLLSGCGTYNSNQDNSLEKNWFLMTTLSSQVAGTYLGLRIVDGGIPLSNSSAYASLFLPEGTNESHVKASLITPDFKTGYSGIASSTSTPALEIPILTATKKLKGTLKHLYYSGRNTGVTNPTQIISDTSMYINDALYITSDGGQKGGVYFYLGESE